MSVRGRQLWIVVWSLGLLFIFEGRPCAAQFEIHDQDIAIANSLPILLLSNPTKGWGLEGDINFLIRDAGLRVPFMIEDAAPNNCIVIDTSGKIGFGTPNPAASLHILKLTRPAIRLEQTTGVAQYYEWEVDVQGRLALNAFNSATFNDTPFAIERSAPTNTLYLTTEGSIGIGTSAPDSNSQVDIRSSLLNGLFMKREDSNSHYLRVENDTGVFRAGVEGTGNVQFGALTPNRGLNLLTGGTSKLIINAAGQISFGSPPPAITNRALVHQSGAHLTSGGAWTNGSSRALKQDIEPITSEQARDTVRALQPVGYRYKSELDERYVGFIAEDVPELVATNDRKGLAPMDITAVLTKVVQDQDKQLGQQQQLIEQQQAALKELTRQMAELKQMVVDGRDQAK
ncbi:MAG: tail fiber domain-containing protein [Candidatus Saccharimonas sp.]|nr:tail fiber domain-containing protein [Planctomycetaceae bacterium]